MNTTPSRFTLVELLTVVAVVLVLLVALLPALTKAMNRAQRAACANNLHQLGTAWHLYAGDYGALPRSHFDVEGARTIPLGLPAPAYTALKTEYKFDYQAARCPASRLPLIALHPESAPAAYATLSYPNYALMQRNGSGQPATVADSATGVEDTNPNAILSADLICLRAADWPPTPDGDTLDAAVNHWAPDGRPQGGNVLLVQGAVAWRSAAEMDVTPDRYEYREGLNRYFW